MLTRRYFFALLAAGLATSAAGQSTQQINVSGMYDAEGMNADGTRYHGQVAVVQQGEEIHMTWVVADDTFYGLGDIDGRVITVNWGDESPIVYVVMENELHGTWANGMALEKLTLR